MAKEHKPGNKGQQGGRQPGAGRPHGAQNIRTAAIGRQLAKKELTPLHILVESMTAFWEEAQRTVEKQPKLALMREACGVAEKAAPYIHARLSSVNATIRKVTSLKDLSDDELLALATSAANEQAVELDAPGVVHRGRPPNFHQWWICGASAKSATVAVLAGLPTPYSRCGISATTPHLFGGPKVPVLTFRGADAGASRAGS